MDSSALICKIEQLKENPQLHNVYIDNAIKITEYLAKNNYHLIVNL